MRYTTSFDLKKRRSLSFVRVIFVLVALTCFLLSACDTIPGINNNGNNSGVNNGNNSPSNSCNGVNNCNNYSAPSSDGQPISGGNQNTGSNQQPITSSGGCFGGRNYQLPSTLSGNVYFRVEFNTNGTWPEYETWLSPGTWNVKPGINGWVWEFPTSCTTEELRADSISSHNRRMAQTQNASGSVLEPTNPIVTSAFTHQ